MDKPQKRVLIISYYWPPSGGPGVQRWLKFAKYLPDFDVLPTVFVPENPHYPQKDKTLESEIPRGLEVIKSKIFEPYRFSNIFSKENTDTLSKGLITEKTNQSIIQRFLLYVRGNFFIPDARKFWVKPSVKKISKLLAQYNYHVIITTGPPHSLHRIGLFLKKRHSDLHWIADFRDPWTTIGYHKQLKLSKSSHQKHLNMEREVLNYADHIIVTSPSTKQEFEHKTNKPVSLITNGFDDVDAENMLDEQFSITHVGTLLNERNPDFFFKAIAELLKEEENFDKHLQLKFVGQVGDAIVESLKKYELKMYSVFEGYVPHTKAQQYMFNAQMLLLIEKNQNETKSIIPGKLFEYLQARRPILAIGPKDWDVKEMLDNQQAGITLTYNDFSGIKEYIRKSYYDFLKGRLTVHYNLSGQYHRRSLTEKLSKIIHQF